MVSSTAAATLRQAVMAIFDKVAEEDNILDSIKDGGEDGACYDAPCHALQVALVLIDFRAYPRHSGGRGTISCTYRPTAVA